MKALFIDRDGTLIHEPADGKIDSMEKFFIFPEVVESLKRLQSGGFTLVMVTNQPGLGTSKLPQEKFDPCHEKLMDIFEKNGIQFQAIFICPHNKEDGCNCMKPKTGLIDGFLEENNIDLERSCVIGDRATDVEMARKIGCKAVLFSKWPFPEADFISNDWNKIADWVLAGANK